MDGEQAGGRDASGVEHGPDGGRGRGNHPERGRAANHPAPSAPRPKRLPRSSRCSTASPMARPAPFCSRWRITWARRPFARACTTTLAAHLYSNATAEDFWGAQTAASGKPVDKIMGSLVAQPGAPILTFGEPAGGKVTVAQKRFFLSPSIQADPAQKWTLPVCFKTGADSQECQVLTPGDLTLNAPRRAALFRRCGAARVTIAALMRQATMRRW